MGKYTYSLILLLTVLFPVIRSFEKRIYFYKNWKRYFYAVTPVAVLFIAGDMIFTYLGVWSFSEDRILGVYIYNLPLEECLFFFCVPFSCIFIYEALNYFFPGQPFKRSIRSIVITLSVVLIATGIIYYDRLYTFIFFIISGLYFLFHLFVLKSNYLGKFLRAYLVCLIPFIIVNGFLTALPVVTYNPDERMGLLIYTIPVEDVFYGMLLILAVLTGYERK